MQCSPHELKDKLLKALDKDNNVVDMPMVLEVISRLEKFPITREQLESTRIGKYVNEMRRKTEDKDLAKRVKNLVRKWKNLIESPGISGSVNGEGIGIKSGTVAPPLMPPHLAQHAGSPLPASPASRPGTPSSVKSPGSPVVKVGPDGTAVGGPSRPNTPSGIAALQQSKLSPKILYSQSGTTGFSDSPFMRGKPGSPALSASPPTSSKHCPGLLASSSQTSTAGHKVNPGNNSICAKQTHEYLSKGTTTSSKRRRNGSDPGCDISNKKSTLSHVADKNGQIDPAKLKDKEVNLPPAVNGLVPGMHDGDFASCGGTDPIRNRGSAPDVSNCIISNTDTASSLKPALSLPRTSSHQNIVTKRNSVNVKCDSFEKVKDKLLPHKPSKVKTTAQLIQEMPDLRVDGSKTVMRITTNQIDKEEDVLNAPVVPPEAKPRPRRTPGTPLAPPSTSAAILSKTKTELVEKFLQSSIPLSDFDFTASRFDHVNRESPSPMDIIESTSNSASISCHSVELLRNQDPKAGIAGGLGERGLPDSAISIQSALPMFDEETINNPWSLLPLVDLDSLEWSDNPYPEPERPEVTDALIDRLHSERWQGVNGQFDYNDVWHEWTQSISLPSYNGDLLHILPYVNIDD